MNSFRFTRTWCVVAAVLGIMWAAGPSAGGVIPSNRARVSGSWEIVASPNEFTGRNILSGVTSFSAQNAWAVGSACCSGRHFGLGTLTEHWDGSAWNVVASPDTEFIDDELLGVSAVSANDVWAVGRIFGSGYGGGAPLIVHWNGIGWSQLQAPAGVERLNAVAAVSANDVWAVGGSTKPTILHWNGESWSVARSLTSNTIRGVLNGVAAASPNDVWAVGRTGGYTLVEHWNGSVWTVVPSPNADVAPSSLRAVTVVSPNDVWAVGLSGPYEYDAPGTRTLVEHWNGAAWQIVASPSIDRNNELRGVAARSPADVRAVGTYTATGFPIDRTLALQWEGTAWSAESSPNANQSDNLLNGAASTGGSGPLWAVGFHLNEAGPYQTLILRSS